MDGSAFVESEPVTNDGVVSRFLESCGLWRKVSRLRLLGGGILDTLRLSANNQEAYVGLTAHNSVAPAHACLLVPYRPLAG